jgi:long-chain fatty acid transport protein
MILKSDETTIMLATYRAFCLLFLGLFPATAAWGSGSLLPRVPADALGMADANVALGDGAAAQITNPAAIANQGEAGTWVIGTVVGRVDTNYLRYVDAGAARAGAYSPETGYPVLPFFAWSGRLSDDLAWGLSLETVFGLGSDWPDHSFDQTLGLDTVDIARESELTTLRVGPTLAWRATDRLALGARVFAQAVEAREESDLARVEGKGMSSGFQVGARYTAESWAAGLAYTSRTDTKLSGDFSTYAPLPVASGDATAHILLPDRLQAGVALRVLPDVWWEVDLDWLGWSYVSELTIVRDDGTILNAGRNARGNDDTLSVRTGIEWRYRPNLTWRAGLGYDPTPTPDRDVSPTSGMVRKSRVALGADIHTAAGLKLGLAYQFIYGHQRRVHDSAQDDIPFSTGRAFEGKYSSRSHAVGITLSGAM